MYSVVISCHIYPELRRIDETHRWVMTRLLAGISRQTSAVQWQGTCDLTLNNRKFSGNSLRVARNHILYHGTILHSADLGLIARCLATPPRQPDYRDGRTHSDFITNLPVKAEQLADDIAAAFDVQTPVDPTTEPDWPRELTHSLTVSRYSDPAWHHRH